MQESTRTNNRVIVWKGNKSVMSKRKGKRAKQTLPIHYRIMRGRGEGSFKERTLGVTKSAPRPHPFILRKDVLLRTWPAFADSDTDFQILAPLHPFFSQLRFLNGHGSSIIHAKDTLSSVVRKKILAVAGVEDVGRQMKNARAMLTLFYFCLHDC